jgi:hypothetical protein
MRACRRSPRRMAGGRRKPRTSHKCIEMQSFKSTLFTQVVRTCTTPSPIIFFSRTTLKKKIRRRRRFCGHHWMQQYQKL